ncbi:hypothetical protein [Streptomyces sp. HB2AG]|uniref:hypothetical protein n=1 Tax=Streptomyces sp. HB2AG TaxID=2983400 RepID=UPI003FA7CFCE
MADGLTEIVLGVAASAVSALLGWLLRTFTWRRRLRRKQRFLGLPDGAECLLVVNRDASGDGRSVARGDTYALMELATLVNECGARAEVLAHDAAWQGFGGRTEFCIGGPASNRRSAAHLSTLLPGVEFDVRPEPGPDRAALTVGGRTYRMVHGSVEYVLLARLAGGERGRPVFLVAGQRSVDNQAAVRHLVRHHVRLSRTYGVNGSFCLLLKVVNSAAYGPDLVEVVADVTDAARTPRAAAGPEGAPEAGGGLGPGGGPGDAGEGTPGSGGGSGAGGTEEARGADDVPNSRAQ